MFDWLRKAETPFTDSEIAIQKENIEVDSFIELLTSSNTLDGLRKNFFETDRYKVPFSDFWINTSGRWGGRKQVLDAMIKDIFNEYHSFLKNKSYPFKTKVKIILYTFLNSWLGGLLKEEFRSVRFKELELEKEICILKQRETGYVAEIDFLRRRFNKEVYNV